MADNHQTQTPPAATPSETTIIQPRSQEAQTPAAATETDSDAKAAREAKERMTKTGGFWNRVSPKEEEKKPEKKAEAKPEPKKEEKPAPAAAKPAEGEPDPKPDKKAKGRKKEQPEIDPIELARETGREIGREMAKASQPAPAPQPAAQEHEVELPEEFRADVAVFDEMARLEPKKYGNIKKDIANYAKAESEYIAKWESEHEGETYDGDAAEHNAFYAKIRPNYEQKDFKSAERRLIEQEVEKKVLDKVQSREAETEQRRERASQIQPEVDRDMLDIMGEMIRETDPESAEFAKDFESMQKLDKTNLLLSHVIFRVHNETKPAVAAAMRLFRAVERPDQNNPIHERIFTVINAAEQKISRLPIKDRYDPEGRLFATQDEYTKMSPAEQERHWYIGERETVVLLRGQAVKRAKTIYDEKKQEIELYSKPSNAAQPEKQPPDKKPDQQPQTRSDNGSPSVSGRGTLPGDGQSNAGKPTNGRDLFFSRHLSA